ncbi:unnamed protein product, partial [Polarella glacialis]
VPYPTSLGYLRVMGRVEVYNPCVRVRRAELALAPLTGTAGAPQRLFSKLRRVFWQWSGDCCW